MLVVATIAKNIHRVRSTQVAVTVKLEENGRKVHFNINQMFKLSSERHENVLVVRDEATEMLPIHPSLYPPVGMTGRLFFPVLRNTACVQ